MSIAQTITEINSIIEDLKTIAEAGGTLDGVAKTAMDARIAHLRNKTAPHGTITLTDDLTDLQNKAEREIKEAIVGLGFRYLGEVV